jgi:ankyrin repeat protein
MGRIEVESPERKSIAMTALSWIYHTRRPLSINELLHVLAVDSSSVLSLSEENIPSRSLVLDVCAGLIVLDTESGAVRFAHYSLHEYFQATYQQWFSLARREIARVCLAYLGLENMACSVNLSGDQLTGLLSSYPLLRYTAQYWGIHVKDGYDRDMEGLALKFLQNYHRVALVAQILDSEENNGERVADMHPCSNLPVQLAARFGAREIVQLLLERGHNPGATDATGRTALHWAARGGFSDVVRAILREGVDPNVKTIDGRTPLHWAAKHGHSNVIADLLRSGANPAEQTRNGRSALHWAASRGHQSVVEILLSDDRVDAGCQSQNGWTALHWAACSGNRAVVIHGVKYSSENNLPTSREWLSMNGGESKGHEEVATLLLEAGVSPHVRNEEGQTAVHWAAASRNGNIIRLLRERGAEMDVQDIHGRTPLDFAVDNGAEDALLAMLSTKVNA